MSLTQFKIGTRLGIGFAVVLGLLVAVLLVGLYSMGQLSARTHDIVADKNVKMAAANTMSDNVRNITLAITSVVVAPTEALVQAEKSAKRARNTAPPRKPCKRKSRRTRKRR